jgi:hypothetical protein
VFALLAGAGIAIYLGSRVEPESPPAPSDTREPAAAPPVAREDPPAAAPGRAAVRPAPTAEPPEAAEAAEAAAPAAEVTLHVTADVPGAEVFVDRRFVGVAPVTTTVAPGTHRINVSATGYDGYGEFVDLEAGRRDVAVRFREVRLDARVEVTHRHGVGSCRGVLVATPAGIRYETSNRDDAFTVPLRAMDTFTVDYLEKRLTVRTSGRTYNFTPADGDADRLLVFHRDVAKARDRLQRGEPPAP